MKQISLYTMSLLYITAGISHFIYTSYYLTILPLYFSYNRELVYLSGGCMIVFGVMLFPNITRCIAAWLIIILLIAIFPANIKMTIDYFQKDDPLLWLTLVRLPIQILLIWWAWTFTKFSGTSGD